MKQSILFFRLPFHRSHPHTHTHTHSEQQRNAVKKKRNIQFQSGLTRIGALDGVALFSSPLSQRPLSISFHQRRRAKIQKKKPQKLGQCGRFPRISDSNSKKNKTTKPVGFFFTSFLSSSSSSSSSSFFFSASTWPTTEGSSSRCGPDRAGSTFDRRTQAGPRSARDATRRRPRNAPCTPAKKKKKIPIIFTQKRLDRFHILQTLIDTTMRTLNEILLSNNRTRQCGPKCNTKKYPPPPKKNSVNQRNSVGFGQCHRQRVALIRWAMQSHARRGQGVADGRGFRGNELKKKNNEQKTKENSNKTKNNFPPSFICFFFLHFQHSVSILCRGCVIGRRSCALKKTTPKNKRKSINHHSWPKKNQEFPRKKNGLRR